MTAPLTAPLRARRKRRTAVAESPSADAIDGLISSPDEVAALADSIRAHGVMGLDTEFITERTYRPRLALVQVSTPDGDWIIDPLAAGGPDAPIWECMADPAVTTVVHAHQQETRFCIERAGRPPANLFDVQLAAAFAGLRYPIGYSALVAAELRRDSAESQSRTEWTRRPLSPAQIRYAADDVHWLLPLHRKLGRRLADSGRLAWLEEETEAALAGVAAGGAGEPRWRKIGGAGKLGPRSLAALRELSEWRDREAARADIPLKRIARDDILAAVAAALPGSLDDLMRIRGASEMPRRHRAPLLEAVARARELPERELPERVRSNRPSGSAKALHRFLEAVLESACADHGVDAGLAGNASDLNELIAARLKPRAGGREPRLLSGWRRDVCGLQLCEAIDGRVALRIGDPRAAHPLVAGPAATA